MIKANGVVNLKTCPVSSSEILEPKSVMNKISLHSALVFRFQDE